MSAEEYLKIEKSSRGVLDEQAKELKVPPEIDEKIKILTSEVETLRNGLANERSHRNWLIEVIENEELGEFREWLEQKRRKEFERADKEFKSKVLKREKLGKKEPSKET